MAKRAELIRSILNHMFQPKRNIFQRLIASPEAWQTALDVTERIAGVTRQIPDPRTSLASHVMIMVLDYLNKDASVPQLPEPAAPSSPFRKRQILIDVQVLQRQIDAMGPDENQELKRKLTMKIDELLNELTHG